jgi:hypothetical protein
LQVKCDLCVGRDHRTMATMTTGQTTLYGRSIDAATDARRTDGLRKLHTHMNIHMHTDA